MPQAEGRGGFGEERYEVSEFQAQVKKQYELLYDSIKNVKPVVGDLGMAVKSASSSHCAIGQCDLPRRVLFPIVDSRRVWLVD